MLKAGLFGSLSHSFTSCALRSRNSRPRAFFLCPTTFTTLPLFQITSLQRFVYTRTMASPDEQKQEWTADKVRETFLGYFKERGHTFGKMKIGSSGWTVSLILYSTVFIGRPAGGSNTSIRQCGHEPVQGHFPGDCRSTI
jgi:hypothetical protein